MLAMLLIGMHNLVWMIALTAVMWTHRFTPAPWLRWVQLAVSAALVALVLVSAVGA
jgi:hypothetical protein